MSDPDSISSDDPVLETDFAKEMVRQMRAVDTYGTTTTGQPARSSIPSF